MTTLIQLVVIAAAGEAFDKANKEFRKYMKRRMADK